MKVFELVGAMFWLGFAIWAAVSKADPAYVMGGVIISQIHAAAYRRLHQ